MNALGTLTVAQLKRAIAIKEQIEALESELGALLDTRAPQARPGKRKVSAAGRARIAAAQRARWAKVRAATGGRKPVRRKRKFSAAARAALSASAKARWAKVKAAGKSRL